MTEKTAFSVMTPLERTTEFGESMAYLELTDRVVQGLESMFRRAGTGTQAGIYAIEAATHLGKTTAQRVFMLQKAAELGGETENVVPGRVDLPHLADVSYVTVKNPDGSLSHPVVRIEINSNPTMTAMVRHVTKALTRGAPETPKLANLNEMTSFFTPYIRKFGIKLIIFDEVQEIGNVVGVHRNQAVVLFKTLCKTGYAQVACAGIEGTLAVLASDQQTTDLVTKRHVFRPLPRPTWDDDDASTGDTTFVDFLESMGGQLPFDHPSSIHERAIAEPMWEFSKGVIGLVKNLLLEATDYAIHHAKPCIDRQVLADVLTHELDLDEAHNPFLGSAQFMQVRA